jgi:ppGpp synthetase/RelA/SpoT-type nucleotidyltranferase
MFNPRDSHALRDAIQRYQHVRPRYQLLHDHLRKQLEDLMQRLGIYPIIMGRVKSIESFAEKIQRPGKIYQDDPVTEMLDLCGFRVITHTLDEVHILAELIQKEFLVDPLQFEDKEEKLAFREFGYLSKHFALHVHEPPQLTGLKAELQLRTMAQHLWADIYHELGYKNEFQLPKRWEREFARLAALLENCDQGFQAIKDAMGTYESSYGAYMTAEQLQDLASRLEILRSIDPDNMHVVHRLVRAYLALEDSTEKLKSVLEDYHNRLQTYAPALRDMGVAYCQVHAPDTEAFARGQRLLQQAMALDPRDIDARSSLGGTYRKQAQQLENQGHLEEASAKRHEAVEWYRQAHYLDPTNPYPLGNYIALELILKKNVGVMHHFRALIEGAVERCQKQIDVRVNLPWAFFDMGVFQLYLGHPQTSLAFYARGIASTSRAWMIRSANSTIRDFIAHDVPLDGLMVLDRLLKLGWWSRAADEEKRQADWSPATPQVPLEHPVLILAGGCAGMEGLYQPQLDRFREALRNFRGTIISGGTRSGIAGLVGELQELAGAEHLCTIGYLPQAKQDDMDTRYRCHRYTAGQDYSLLEALTYWEDILGCGTHPRQVKVLGFNGGNISAGEYRIALALGAQVGIVAQSGRAADELLIDPLWQECVARSETTTRGKQGTLYPLHLDHDDLKWFLGS